MGREVPTASPGQSQWFRVHVKLPAAVFCWCKGGSFPLGTGDIPADTADHWDVPTSEPSHGGTAVSCSMASTQEGGCCPALLIEKQRNWKFPDHLTERFPNLLFWFPEINISELPISPGSGLEQAARTGGCGTSFPAKVWIWLPHAARRETLDSSQMSRVYNLWKITKWQNSYKMPLFPMKWSTYTNKKWCVCVCIKPISCIISSLLCNPRNIIYIWKL